MRKSTAARVFFSPFPERALGRPLREWPEATLKRMERGFCMSGD